MRFAGRALIALAWAGAMTVACSGTDDDSEFAPVGAAPPVSEVQKSATWAVPETTPTKPAPSKVPAPKVLAGKVIVLDPGHNGGNASHPEEINRQVDIITGRKACNTTGTETDGGYSEHAYNWDVALRLAKVLKQEGAKVVLTRKNDVTVGPCIDQRAAIATKAKADAVLSIHADGAKATDHGFHVILPGLVAGHNDKIIAPSRRLGVSVRNAFKTGTGISYSTYRGRQALDVRTDLGGLNLATRPTVIIECANMRNNGDAAKLTSPAFRQRAAESLATGLTAFLI